MRRFFIHFIFILIFSFQVADKLWAAPPRFTATQVLPGSLGGFAVANDINNLSQVVGSVRSNGNYLPSIWSPPFDRPRVLISPIDLAFAEAYDISDTGKVIGTVELAPNASGYLGHRMIEWALGIEAYKNIHRIDIAPDWILGSLETYGSGSNNRGLSVGSYFGIFETNGSNSQANAPDSGDGIPVDPTKVHGIGVYPFIDFNGVTITLEVLGRQGGSADSINDKNQITGTLREANFRFAGFWQETELLAYLALPEFLRTGGEDINNRAEIVGYGVKQFSPRHIESALYWNPINSQVIELPSLGGDRSRATSINRFGKIVGRSQNADLEFRAFYFDGDQLYDLNTLISDNTDPSFVLINAKAINDGGQILATGIDDGVYRSFILTPE